MMVKMVNVTALACGIMLTASSAQACRLFSPTGANGTTNIRSGATLDAPLQDSIYSTLRPTFRYCGTWRPDRHGRIDDNGNLLIWMKVNYSFGGYERTGWIATIVAGTPYQDGDDGADGDGDSGNN